MLLSLDGILILLLFINLAGANSIYSSTLRISLPNLHNTDGSRGQLLYNPSFPSLQPRGQTSSRPRPIDATSSRSSTAPSDIFSHRQNTPKLACSGFLAKDCQASCTCLRRPFGKLYCDKNIHISIVGTRRVHLIDRRNQECASYCNCLQTGQPPVKSVPELDSSSGSYGTNADYYAPGGEDYDSSDEESNGSIDEYRVGSRDWDRDRTPFHERPLSPEKVRHLGNLLETPFS
jgi:hypothetical protein